jgi:hypothetical protein
LCFNKRSSPGRSFISESVTLLVDILYAEAIEAVKSRAALSASTPDLISIFGVINSEARLWNSRYIHYKCHFLLKIFFILFLLENFPYLNNLSSNASQLYCYSSLLMFWTM